jgi:uncharacterized membrane protein
VLLLHVLAAFAYGTGYIATNVLTELARRTDDPAARGQALHFSGVFDRMLNVVGGTLTGITGVIAVFVFGYSLLTPWILAAIVLYVVIVGTGILFWGPVGREIERAGAVGDAARVSELLRSPRNVAVSRSENVLFLALVALMVLRPGT